MPKFMFQCQSCDLQFERTLKAGTHENHICPQCSQPAPRYWDGQGFAPQFQEGQVPGNSGVAKLDYPTADQAVGSSADKRWEQYQERDGVKNKVRGVGGTHKLIRRHVEGAIEYQAMEAGEAQARKSLAKEAVAKLKDQPA
jgi:hypothetical protein